MAASRVPTTSECPHYSICIHRMTESTIYRFRQFSKKMGQKAKKQPLRITLRATNDSDSDNDVAFDTSTKWDLHTKGPSTWVTEFPLIHRSWNCLVEKNISNRGFNLYLCRRFSCLTHSKWKATKSILMHLRLILCSTDKLHQFLSGLTSYGLQYSEFKDNLH